MPKIVRKSLIFFVLAAFITINLLFNLLSTSCCAHKNIVASCCCHKDIQGIVSHSCKCLKNYNSAIFQKEVAKLSLNSKLQDKKCWTGLSISFIKIYNKQIIAYSKIDFVGNFTLKRLKTVVILS